MESLEDLEDAVLHPKTRTINLSNQEGALTTQVLEKVRAAVHRNEMFHRIILSSNVLNDDCVATVGALVKDRNHIIRYEMKNCELNDKQLTLHLVPALLLKKRVTGLHVDKNKELTNECVAAICRLIAETNLTELSMVGTSITEVGGAMIAEAVERSPIMVGCEMPYSIGFVLIDKIADILQRNRAKFSQLERHAVPAPEFKSSPDEWNYQDQRVLHLYRTKKRRRQALIMDPVNPYTSISARDGLPASSMESFLLPAIKPVSKTLALTPCNFPSKDLSSNNIPGCPTSRSMINSWADPTVKNTLVSLHMLTERSGLQRRHKKLVKNQIVQANGLGSAFVETARKAHNLPLVSPRTTQKSLVI